MSMPIVVNGGSWCRASHEAGPLLRPGAALAGRPPPVAGSRGQRRNYGDLERAAGREGVSVCDRLAGEVLDWPPETSSGAGVRRCPGRLGEGK